MTHDQPLPQALPGAQDMDDPRDAIRRYLGAAAAQAALDDLNQSWGAFRDVAARDGAWFAQRPGDGTTITAASPDELERMLVADCTARPAELSRGTW